ncbi:MAG: triose-phosphate isomerase [Clostridia bacterium]|nr:triose-phosphate isomerase [Clostridia bacterium]
MAYYCKKTVADIDCSGKKVIVRVDFNVPFDSEGNISDDKRIVGALPTIKYLLDRNAAVILVSHLGRPKGEFNPKYSMAPASKRLSELLGKEVIQAADVIGPDAKAKAEALKPGEIMMLENARFHKEEEKNNPDFAKELASMAEIYVNDAFGTAHRAHATTAGLADYLPAVSGFLIEKEIAFLGNAVNSPVHPFVAILGGAKVADKLSVISSLLDKCDTLIIGGGMAYTFLKAQGYAIGTSLVDNEKIDYCKSMIEKAEKSGKKLLLPVDAKTIAEFPNPIDAPVTVEVYDYDKMPDDRMGCDIGPATCELFANEIKNARTVVWNGPMGVFENPILAEGTIAVAKALAEAEATTIVGGGDSAAAVEQLGFADAISHISTGGGASLEFLEGRDLPGISCLENKDRRIVAAGNWKMNKTPSEAKAFITELAAACKDAKNDIIAAVPFVAIPAALEAAAGTNIKIAAQNMDYHDKGAYTGEVSAEMLCDLGVRYVIIGHSERRQYYNETDETVNLKVRQAIRYGITPIVCVGESKDQRLAGVTNELVAYQVEYALNGVRDDLAAGIIIAYEPIWAIGTGLTATDEQAEEVCKVIRETVKKLYGSNVSSVITIQYGGSCNAKNAAGLFAMENIDGGLVGGASLKVPDFSIIANS